MSSQLPELNKSQAVVLALSSFGVVLMQSSAMLGRKDNRVRQQRREFCHDAPDPDHPSVDIPSP